METLVCACSRQFTSRIHRDVRRTYMTRLQCIRRLSIYRCLQESKKDHSDKKKALDKEKSQKNETKTKTEAEPPVSAVSPTIIQQILSMKISGGIAGDDVPNAESKLNLAKPVDRRGKRLEEKKAVEEIQREAPGVSVDLIKATREVASNIGGDVEKTKSELLTKLLQHTGGETGSVSKTGVSDIIAGMQVDRQDKAKVTSSDIEFGGYRDGQIASSSDDLPIKMTHLQTPKRYVSKTDLFGAPRLNIFSKEESVERQKGPLVLNTWEMLQRRELDLLVTHPPKNAFEEEIQWLKQGKVWRFPIDNEQGMDEEKRIGFHEHVFLEPLISDFPKKGPIRHFMELVIVGLSKNPYITVEQKKADIDWFRQYFKERKSVLENIGAL